MDQMQIGTNVPTSDIHKCEGNVDNDNENENNNENNNENENDNENDNDNDNCNCNHNYKSDQNTSINQFVINKVNKI